MSKRNFILLIIILATATIGIFTFFFTVRPTPYPRKMKQAQISFHNLTLLGKSKLVPPVVTPPVDVSEYVPPPSRRNIKGQTGKSFQYVRSRLWTVY